MELKMHMQSSSLKSRAVTAIGCFFVALTVAATPAHAQQKRQVVEDLANRKVSVKIPVKKAVIAWSGSGGPFMTMSALLGKDVHKHIAGWGNSLPKFRKDMYDAYIKAVPELANIPDVGSPDKDDFNVEKVIASAPDVAIFPLGMKSGIEATAGKKLEAAGIPIVYMDYHAETVANHRKSTLLLGQLFGKDKRARELADLYSNKRKEIAKRVAKARAAGKKAPKVYVEVGYKGPSVYGNTYSSKVMWGAVVGIAGGNNVAGTKVTKYAPISPEFLLQAAPEVIILTGSYWPKSPGSLLMGYTANKQGVQQGLSAFAKRPGWHTFDAIKNKRLYAVHHGVGRELFDYTSMIAFAKFIYPEEFKDLNPHNELKTYFRKYLPYELSGVWFQQWK